MTAEAEYQRIKSVISDPNGFSLLKLKTESEKIKLKDKKTAIDVALRCRMLEILSLDAMDEVKALLKMTVAAALANICSAPTPFLLFADVFNTKPISTCEELFRFMEETITTLKDAETFFFACAMVDDIPLMCKKYLDLLRRLSKSQNTVFCGQIQLFLSRLFPLDEKSGLNLMSNFNIEKETPYNKSPDPTIFISHCLLDSSKDDLEEGETTDAVKPIDVDVNLYVKFWSVQDFFKVPTDCYSKEKWQHFQASTETILEVFSSIKLLCFEDSAVHSTRNVKKFSKYLTSEKLLDLQLMDVSFRRYILVQFLLIFQYLTTPNKFKTSEQALTDTQIDWIERKREAVLRLLCDGPTGAKSADSFAASVVERILEREVYWNRWKNDGCPSFVRAGNNTSPIVRKRRTNPLVDRAGNKIYRFGNRELDKLWNVCPDNLTACRDERRLFRPDLRTHFRDAILELDPAEKVGEEYKSVNREEWSWRALRCLSRRSPHFYINWNPPGRPVKDYLVHILTEKLQSERPNTPDDRKQILAGSNTHPVLPGSHETVKLTPLHSTDSQMTVAAGVQPSQVDSSGEADSGSDDEETVMDTDDVNSKVEPCVLESEENPVSMLQTSR